MTRCPALTTAAFVVALLSSMPARAQLSVEPAEAVDPSQSRAAPMAQQAAGPVTFGEQVVWGKGRPRIVLLNMDAFPDEAWGAVERHASAELSAAGLQVIQRRSIATSLQERLAELGAQASTHGAVGAVRVVRRAGRPTVQVWIYDAITRKMLLREATSDKAGDGAGIELAKNVVELLNASLIEIKMRKRRPIRQVPKTITQLVAKSLPKRTPPPADRFFLAADTGAAIPLSGANPGATLQLWAGGRPLEWLGLAAQIRLPLMPQRLGQDRALADISVFAFRGLALLEPWRPRVWSLAAGLGAGARLIRATGGPEQLSDWTAAPELDACLTLAWRISSAVRLRASLLAALPLGEPKVAFAANSENGTGVIDLEAMLGAQWSW